MCADHVLSVCPLCTYCVPNSHRPRAGAAWRSDPPPPPPPQPQPPRRRRRRRAATRPASCRASHRRVCEMLALPPRRPPSDSEASKAATTCTTRRAQRAACCIPTLSEQRAGSSEQRAVCPVSLAPFRLSSKTLVTRGPSWVRTPRVRAAPAHLVVGRLSLCSKAVRFMRLVQRARVSGPRAFANYGWSLVLYVVFMWCRVALWLYAVASRE